MMRSPSLPVAMVVVVAAAVACRSGSTAEPPVPGSLQQVGGQGQVGVVAQPLEAPLEVRVLNTEGSAMAGVTVQWQVTDGGGSLASTSTATGADGSTTATWTLGTTVGPNGARASVSGLEPVTFAATATAGPAATVTIQAGDGQTAPVGSAVPVAPAVLVRDAFGNPVAGAQVAFAVTTGGGSVSGGGGGRGGGGGGGGAGGNEIANAAGIATVGSWRLGPTPGTNTLTATVAGVSPVVFTATGVAAMATSGP